MMSSVRYMPVHPIPDATVFAMSPPMIAGYGMGNGLALYSETRQAAMSINSRMRPTAFVEALSKRPEIGEVYSAFATDYPQYWVDIDAAAVNGRACHPWTALSTLSGTIPGNMFRISTAFQKLFHVTMQAPAEYRMLLPSRSTICICAHLTGVWLRCHNS